MSTLHVTVLDSTATIACPVGDVNRECIENPGLKRGPVPAREQAIVAATSASVLGNYAMIRIPLSVLGL